MEHNIKNPQWRGKGEMEQIVGKTPVAINIRRDNGDEIRMGFSDGSQCMWYHSQDCCEDVRIEDVCGSWNDLIGYPLLVAEERTEQKDIKYGSMTYTFYTFRGVGGSVDVRWYGESNGYYSESVDFHLEEQGEKNELER